MSNAGGSSKYVCLYDVVEKVMLRRFQLSSNRSLDGVLDQLNSSNITDGGPLDLIADAASDEEDSPGGSPFLPCTLTAALQHHTETQHACRSPQGQVGSARDTNAGSHPCSSCGPIAD